MYRAGFLNYVVPQSEVLSKALEPTHLIAEKSLPALRARERVYASIEGLSWCDSYLILIAQVSSADLVGEQEADEGVQAVLEHRPAPPV